MSFLLPKPLSGVTLIAVRNVDSTNNSGGAIMHQVECNIYYKSHVERMRIDTCDLGKTKAILGMPWLAAHNPEINWETGEVKIMGCLPLCSGIKVRREERKKVKRVATEEEKKIVQCVRGPLTHDSGARCLPT